MHESIKRSGLGSLYNISPETDDPELAKWIGKTVRYRRDLINADFLKAHGTRIVDATFIIRETQLNYEGREILRGYTNADSFGTPINPEHIEEI